MARAAVKYNTVSGKGAESTFLGFIGEQRGAIRNRVFEYLPRVESGSMVAEHSEMVRDYPERGGKYVRPGLVLLSCAASGVDISKAMTTAAAMEISEDWILIHDDFHDHSEKRRGKVSLPILKGDELAVNAGDHLHILMWRALLSNQKSLESLPLTVEIAEEMGSILQTTCEGQFLDLSWMLRGEFIAERQYYEMVDRKTCWYTIIGPLRLGALVAGNRDALGPLVKFGLPLGRAFQIHDDWLNVFSKNTGKEFGGDILEGKRTLLLIHLLEGLEKKGKKAEADRVRELFRMKRVQRTDEDVKHIVELYTEYGCSEWARGKALKYAEEARKALQKVPFAKKEYVRILDDAVDFLVDREI